MKFQLNNVNREVARRNNDRVEERRFREEEAARDYVAFSGEWPDAGGECAPPYGKSWNFDYNPTPYPEAVPDAEMYEGTGVGFLYGFDSSEGGMLLRYWQKELAGWKLTRDHPEVRRTSQRVTKKELSAPEGRN